MRELTVTVEGGDAEAYAALRAIAGSADVRQARLGSRGLDLDNLPAPESVPGPQGPPPETATTTEPADEPEPVERGMFSSKTAHELALEHDLTAADFENVTPSSAGGDYTAADVRAVVGV